jgi:hypothetical protein
MGNLFFVNTMGGIIGGADDTETQSQLLARDVTP